MSTLPQWGKGVLNMALVVGFLLVLALWQEIMALALVVAAVNAVVAGVRWLWKWSR